MKWLELVEVVDGARFGGKALQLGAAVRAGLPVPRGFALAADELAQFGKSDAGADLGLEALFEQLGSPVAARSSGVGEDAAAISFAGQHLSVLNIQNAAKLREALANIFASAHSATALAYRTKHSVEGDIRIGVVVQQLIAAKSAGVLFTENPVTHAREIVIEASFGLGEAVVSGLVTPDQYRVAPDGRVLEYRRGEKDLMIVLDPAGGTREQPVPPKLVNGRCLDEKALRQLAELATQCQAEFGDRLDLEWAFTQAGELKLLQVRPIT